MGIPIFLLLFFFNGGKTLCGVRGNPRHTQDTSNMYENFNNKWKRKQILKLKDKKK